MKIIGKRNPCQNGTDGRRRLIHPRGSEDCGGENTEIALITLCELTQKNFKRFR